MTFYNGNLNPDSRAWKIHQWLKDNPTPDAMKCICYAIQKLEKEGELEIFVSDEINSTKVIP